MRDDRRDDLITFAARTEWRRPDALHWVAMAELSLDDLAIFVRVVERGGFSGAARDLGVPTSNISRAVARLESDSGVQLLVRTTRTVRSTPEGQDLYVAAAPAIAALRGAARSVEPATRRPRGRLRVTAPTDLASTFLADVIVGFAARYPAVNLEFALSNEHANLVDKGFDIAVRAATRLVDSSLIARKLGQLELGLYAAPRYLQEHGTPASHEELAGHACVVFRAEDLTKTWTLHGPRGDANVRVQGRIGGDDFAFVRSLVVAGAGIGVLPCINCAGHEVHGQLVRVLPQLHAWGATLYVLYPSARNVPARVTAFRDHVTEAFDAWSARTRKRPSP